MKKVLVTGICGFAGSTIAIELRKFAESIDIIGIDNLSRKGSEKNLIKFPDQQIQVFRGDIRCESDLSS